MSEPFLAEIRIFAGNFAPQGWAFCDGQLLPISQNTALFSLLGTTYGGDGESTFALPDLQGRAPMHPGSGPGLTPRQLGQRGGSDTVTLTEAQIPSHTHSLRAAPDPGDLAAPAPQRSLGRSAGGFAYRQTPDSMVPLAESGTPSVGGSQAHNNMQPYLTMHFIIALVGLFPSRP